MGARHGIAGRPGVRRAAPTGKCSTMSLQAYLHTPAAVHQSAKSADCQWKTACLQISNDFRWPSGLSQAMHPRMQVIETNYPLLDNDLHPRWASASLKTIAACQKQQNTCLQLGNDLQVGAATLTGHASTHKVQRKLPLRKMCLQLGDGLHSSTKYYMPTNSRKNLPAAWQ